MSETPGKLARYAVMDQLSEEALQSWADCRSVQITVGQACKAAQSVAETLRPHLHHDRDCLSRKGAHYGPESCDCGLTQILERM